MKNNYNKKYFEFQKSTGQFVGIIFRDFYNKHIKGNMKVVDFGCGGGYLLENIECKYKIGIEINKTLHNDIKAKGIMPYESLCSIKDDDIDVFIMHSVIGHLKNPLEVVNQISKKLKEKGIVIVYLPHDNHDFDLIDDINNIYFSFSKRNIRNVFNSNNFKLVYHKHYKSSWPPFYSKIFQIFGKRIFNFLSLCFGLLFNKVRYSHYIFKKDSIS